jgi:uncharacterized protein YjiS (DUF1127 family)
MYKLAPYPTHAADNLAAAVATLVLETGSLVRALIVRQSELHRQRKARRQLEQLSDRLLRDIGLTRQDVSDPVAGDLARAF